MLHLRLGESLRNKARSEIEIASALAILILQCCGRKRMLTRHDLREGVWLSERRILQDYLGQLPLRRVIALLRRHFNAAIVLVVKAVTSGIDFLVRSLRVVLRRKTCE